MNLYREWRNQGTGEKRYPPILPDGRAEWAQKRLNSEWKPQKWEKKRGFFSGRK